MPTTDPSILTTPADRPYVYTFIPRLKHLLPKLQGLPGVEYAIIHVGRKRQFQDEGWRGVEGTMVFTIENPDTGKAADCELLCKGKPIPGQGHLAGTRRAYIDPTVYKLTGFKPEGGSEDPPKAPTNSGGSKPPAPSGNAMNK